MKKIVSTILASALALSLCACNTVSREEYEALNSRVSALEQQANNGDTNTPVETTNPINPVETTESASTTETTSQVSNNYTLEGMTAEEIYAECQKIFQKIPQTKGMTISEYYSCLGYTPTNLDDPYNNTVPNWTFAGDDYSNNIMNCISRIEVSGLKEQMDGTIGYSVGDNGDSGLWIYTSIYINLTDYETASAVYNLMTADSKYTITQNNQTGTTWYANAQSSTDYWQVAWLEKRTDANGNDYYRLTLTDLLV